MKKPFAPSEKPKLTKAELFEKYIPSNHQAELLKHKVFLVWVKSYYLNSVDSNGYNDALFLLYKDGEELKMESYNGSCNPSLTKKGTPTLVSNTIFYAHCLDEHRGEKSKPYRALCQRLGDVTVQRIGEDKTDTGRFGINLHKGGVKSLNSKGCMTTPTRVFFRLMTELLTVLGEKEYALPLEKRTIVPIVIYDDLRIKKV